MTQRSNLQVVAATHHDIDYDAVQFVKTGQEAAQLTVLHNETVKTALEMRQKVVGVAFNALKGLL